MSAHVILLGMLALFTAIAAFTDYRTGRIPNGVVVLLAATGASVQLVAASRAPGGRDLALGAGIMLLGVTLCAAVPLILYRSGAMGGGDVKLLAAIGVAAGPMLGLEIELTAFVLAALYAGARLAYRGELLRMLGNSLALAANPLRSKPRRRPVPEELMTTLRFAPAVCASTLLSLVAHWRGP